MDVGEHNGDSDEREGATFFQKPSDTWQVVIIGVFILIMSMFTIEIFWVLGGRIPLDRQAKTDIELMPQRDCHHLTDEAFVDCMVP